MAEGERIGSTARISAGRPIAWTPPLSKSSRSGGGCRCRRDRWCAGELGRSGRAKRSPGGPSGRESSRNPRRCPPRYESRPDPPGRVGPRRHPPLREQRSRGDRQPGLRRRARGCVLGEREQRLRVAGVSVHRGPHRRRADLVGRLRGAGLGPDAPGRAGAVGDGSARHLGHRARRARIPARRHRRPRATCSTRHGVRLIGGFVPLVLHDRPTTTRRLDRRAPDAPSCSPPPAARCSCRRPWPTPAGDRRSRCPAGSGSTCSACSTSSTSCAPTTGSIHVLHPHAGTLVETCDDVRTRARRGRTCSGVSTPVTSLHRRLRPGRVRRRRRRPRAATSTSKTSGCRVAEQRRATARSRSTQAFGEGLFCPLGEGDAPIAATVDGSSATATGGGTCSSRTPTSATSAPPPGAGPVDDVRDERRVPTRGAGRPAGRLMTVSKRGPAPHRPTGGTHEDKAPCRRAILAAGALVLAACGDDDDDGGDAVSGDTDGAGGTEATTAGTADGSTTPSS